MTKDLKEKFLETCGWFTLNNKWHCPNLVTGMDLDSAFLYESFKRKDEQDERVFGTGDDV